MLSSADITSQGCLAAVCPPCLFSMLNMCVAMQELVALNANTAKAAILQFQSCVRTTLLLCDGYECQEKVSKHCLLPAAS